MTQTELRCSDVSELLGEPLAGTAPTDGRWLFVEQAGSWSRQAAEELLPEIPGVRRMLIRRHGRDSTPATGVRCFAVEMWPASGPASGPVVSTVVLDDLADLAEASATAFEGDGWTAHRDPLWLVCTNGRRDECCAVRGRPVAAALAERWPEHTWETTHLGGHRFAPTLLALPSGYVLGRVPPDRAVAAAEQILTGELPLDLMRGRAGLPPEAQLAELHVRGDQGSTGLGEVQVRLVEGDDVRSVTLDTPAGKVVVAVEALTAEPRRTSCADVVGKSVTTYSAAPRGTSPP